MNFEITTLAEELNVIDFVSELIDREIDWYVEYADNEHDYSDGICEIQIHDMLYQFVGGELIDVHVLEY
jgi:hypothetical protein